VRFPRATAVRNHIEGGNDVATGAGEQDGTTSDALVEVAAVDGADGSVSHDQNDAGADAAREGAAGDGLAEGDAGNGSEAGCTAPLVTCGDAGSCVSLSDDVRNCGACGHDCTLLTGISASTAVGCSSGRCTYQCLSGYADCADAGTGCFSLAANPNCGAGNANCADAGELCSPGTTAGAYACTLDCTAGTTLCGSTCVNETANAQPNAPNCGGCGTQFNCSGGKTCQGSACACTGGQTDCGGTCTNTMVDNNNCGAYGNACPGAASGETCSGGHCQAYSIASASTPFALATDGVHVFYLSTASPASSTTIASVPVGGGVVSGPFPAVNAVTIVTDAVDVYWGGTGPAFSTGFINLAPVGNIGTSSSVESNFTDPIEQLYADVADGYLKFGVFCDGILSAPLKTTAAQQAGATGGFNGCQGSIAAGNFDRVYWANPTTVPYTQTQNGLTGLFVSSSNGPITLSSASGIQGIALQGLTLYYTDSAGGTVSRVPADGSASPNQIASATSPRGLVADSSNVYWIDGGGTAIMRVALGGGQTTILAMGQSATAIAQDGAFIYWTNANAIMRVPK
jgi:hypothetical protein